MSPVLPDAVRAIAPQLEAQGEGNQRWFGLLVYRARLWSMRGGWKPAGPFALEIRYAHSLRGADIAKRSIDEMQHIGVSDSPMLQRWQSAMQKLFPDVRDGDVLIGLATAEGQSRFFLNGEPIGQIDDPGFTAAFFGIWLSPKTSAPGLRRELLGLAQ